MMEEKESRYNILLHFALCWNTIILDNLIFLRIERFRGWTRSTYSETREKTETTKDRKQNK